MQDVDQKWWDIIKPPQGQMPAQGNGLMGVGSPLMDWLSNPRQRGVSSAPQAPQVPQPQPQAPAPQTGGGMDAAGILSSGYGYHPDMGFLSLTPAQKMQAQAMQNASTPRVKGDDAILRWLMSQGMTPYGDQAQGVSGVTGNGPEGTDGGIY